jgi:hypothetical protein
MMRIKMIFKLNGVIDHKAKQISFENNPVQDSLFFNIPGVYLFPFIKTGISL